MLLSSNDYELLELVGEGASGKVFKGTHKATKETVAIKVIKTDKNQERSAKEEISLLQQLGHVPNVIPLRDSIISPAHSECVLIFPYFEHDLSGLLSENRLSLAQAKCYLKQLLVGAHGMHSSGFMHRDIKAANLLLDNKGQLVIGDLGTAAQYTKKGTFSDKVVTLWYRAPELLLGSTNYGPEVDMWSIGCVFIELMTSKNFLPGTNEQEQLDRIFKTCGTPTEESYPGVVSLPGYPVLQNAQLHPRKLQEILAKEGFTRDALELVDAMMSLDPSKRPTAQQALSHNFFMNEPLPLELNQMPTYSSVHVLDLRRKREDRPTHISRSQHSQQNPHYIQQTHLHQSQSRHQSPPHYSRHSQYSHHPHSPQHSHHQRSPQHSHYQRSPQHSYYQRSPQHSPTHQSRYSPQHSPQSWSTQSHYPSSPPGNSYPHPSSPTHGAPKQRRTESPHKHQPKHKVVDYGTNTDIKKGFIPEQQAQNKEKVEVPVKEKPEPVKIEKKRELIAMVVHIPTALYINGEWPEGGIATTTTPSVPAPTAVSAPNPYLQPAKKRKAQ